MDVLAEVLKSTGFRGTLLAQLQSNGGTWGCAIDRGDTAGFHLIADGTCWLRTPEAPPLQLVSGDVVLLPRGTAHDLVGEPQAVAQPFVGFPQRTASDGADVVDLGGEGPRMRVVCGKFEYATTTDRHPVLAVLPEVIHVPGMAADPHLQDVIRILASESANGLPGARSIATRLTEVLFVLTVRHWLASASHTESGASWLTALQDPQIGTALSLMHDQPARDWTVDSLAEQSAMSRPAFARRFKAVVGTTPAAYLTRVRLDQAARRLRETDDSLSGIARTVGYTSEFTFSRAFSREQGISPARYRRTSAEHRRGSDPGEGVEMDATTVVATAEP